MASRQDSSKQTALTASSCQAPNRFGDGSQPKRPVSRHWRTIMHGSINGLRWATSSRRFAAVVLAATMGGSAPLGAQEFVMKFGNQTQNDVQHEFMKVFKAAV